MGVVVGVPAVFVVAYYFDRKALAVNVYFSVSTDQFIISMNAATVVDFVPKEQSLWLFHAQPFIAFSVDSEGHPIIILLSILFFFL
mmetsp:Transcript_26764/g.41465  ORF Transcript_26764/g.41465 Transcript_26764/m.41465 type:complete len:86 (-) Transcript_26764:106-363(-)